jgi:hypothetical protein
MYTSAACFVGKNPGTPRGVMLYTTVIHSKRKKNNGHRFGNKRKSEIRQCCGSGI